MDKDILLRLRVDYKIVSLNIKIFKMTAMKCDEVSNQGKLPLGDAPLTFSKTP